jgi:hypothetical protein
MMMSAPSLCFRACFTKARAWSQTQVQEDQDKPVANTLVRERPHREEIALPERGGVDLEFATDSYAKPQEESAYEEGLARGASWRGLFYRVAPKKKLKVCRSSPGA